MNPLQQYEESRKYFKLQYFVPYDYQRKFYSLRGVNGKVAKGRALIAGNRVGKTMAGGYETACHATGIYPDWWEGIRFSKPPDIVCVGVNAYKTRDIIQKHLLGTSDKDDKNAMGSGWIPRHLIIGDPSRKPGIPGAVEKIKVKHVNGVSNILLLGHEDKKEKFMGEPYDFCWPDEEPPQDIWSQLIRGTVDTRGSIMATFTPESGMTQVVQQFILNCPDHYAWIGAAWDDCPHIANDPDYIKELEKEFPPYEIEMRRSGKPLSGSSIIFPVKDEDICCEPIVIPEHWPTIIGMDFGGDHPFAVVKMAFDPTNKKKKAYVIDCIKKSRLTISQEASIIKGMGGDKIPVAWPHDGNKLDKESGRTIADLYRKEGVKMLENPFSNPPDTGDQEGTGGIGTDAGLKRMYWAMTEGRFFVSKHLQDWFNEKNAYHTKANEFGDVKIVRINEDLMSATRYAYQSALNNDDSFRYAKVMKNTGYNRKIEYDLGFVH